RTSAIQPLASPNSESRSSDIAPSKTSSTTKPQTSPASAVPTRSGKVASRPSGPRRGRRSLLVSVMTKRSLRPHLLRLAAPLGQGGRLVVLADHLVAGVALDRLEARVPDQVEQVLAVHRGRRAVRVG